MRLKTTTGESVVGGKGVGGGEQINIGNIITIIIENIQEANIQVRNIENELSRSPGTSTHLDVTEGSAKALPVLSDFWSQVLCTFLAFQISISFISWSSAFLLESFLSCPGLHINSAQ